MSMKWLVTEVWNGHCRLIGFSKIHYRMSCLTHEIDKQWTRVFKDGDDCPVKIGDILNEVHRDALTRASERLKKIGIDIEYSGNIPWIYLDKVNGVRVRYYNHSMHGFTVAYSSEKNIIRHRREMFNLIRKMINEVPQTV